MPDRPGPSQAPLRAALVAAPVFARGASWKVKCIDHVALALKWHGCRPETGQVEGQHLSLRARVLRPLLRNLRTHAACRRIRVRVHCEVQPVSAHVSGQLQLVVAHHARPLRRVVLQLPHELQLRRVEGAPRTVDTWRPGHCRWRPTWCVGIIVDEHLPPFADGPRQASRRTLLARITVHVRVRPVPVCVLRLRTNPVRVQDVLDMLRAVG
mmetsp:Transcript_104973/g.321594  ORF Transcript_104973/g.321594 Transcript_104973/m.321594 type:complete len:211 (-) Transcript_104973:1239-1871(-)